MSDINYLNMSDEDFLKQAPPEPSVQEEPEVDEQSEQEPEQQEVEEVTENQEPETSEEAEEQDKDDEQEQNEPKETKVQTKPEVSPEAKDKEPTKQVSNSPEDFDYKSAYEQIMAPFKANGKEIKLNNPDEVIRLMQMGANYTKKMQALQPQQKLLRMLENNQLDESKLNYLIDLHSGNKEAIKKLVKDAGIDSFELSSDEPSNYTPGNHQVSNEEVALQTVMDELDSTPTGPELITEVAQQWDEVSKQEIFKNPGILSTLNQQKQSGIYSAIMSEIHRRQTLGHLNGVPYLQAYVAIGQELEAKGAFTPKQKVATQAAPKKVDTSAAKAKAAAPTKTAPKKVQQNINYLAMSDEDFLKQMKGRV